MYLACCLIVCCSSSVCCLSDAFLWVHNHALLAKTNNQTLSCLKNPSYTFLKSFGPLTLVALLHPNKNLDLQSFLGKLLLFIHFIFYWRVQDIEDTQLQPKNSRFSNLRCKSTTDLRAPFGSSMSRTLNEAGDSRLKQRRSEPYITELSKRL